MTTLNNAKKNVDYVIRGFNSEINPIIRRFMELGLIRGEKIKIISTSIQKKVFLIEVRDYTISVRAELLNCVEVEQC